MPTLTDAARQLAISEKTLRKWMKRLEMKPARHDYDWRFYVLSDEQVQQIKDARAKMPGAQSPILGTNALRAKSDGLGYRDASPSVAPTPRQRPLQRATVSASQQMLASNPLPPGWMAVSTFCRRHNLNDRSVGRSSHMPPPTVAPDGAPWGNFSPKANIWQALHTVYTAEQVRQAVAQAARYWPQRFTACPDCPHDEDTFRDTQRDTPPAR